MLKNYLSVAGLNRTESYLLKEVEAVVQGVRNKQGINTLVWFRQMLRKVRIIEAGDTKKLLPGSLVDIHNFTDANREAFKHRKRPATAKPVFFGTTKASLETESFLSAASSRKKQQESTDAAIKGKRDDVSVLKKT